MQYLRISTSFAEEVIKIPSSLPEEITAGWTASVQYSDRFGKPQDGRFSSCSIKTSQFLIIHDWGLQLGSSLSDVKKPIDY